MQENTKAVLSHRNNVTFRKLLLTKCQKEFESDSRDEIKEAKRLNDIALTNPEKKKELTEELEEKLRKSRIRSLCNIKFLGELYLLYTFVTPIVLYCLKKLLQAEDGDSLECLCMLLTTVGKKVETDKMQDSAKELAPIRALIDECFAGIKKALECKRMSFRVRFKIQDVIELRLNNWVPHRIENKPETVDQTHVKAEKEPHEQHSMTQQTLPPSSGKKPDDRDQTETLVESKLITEYYDPSKGTLKPVSKPLEADSIQLGPSTGTWSRGSSGGGSELANQDELKCSMPANRTCSNEESPEHKEVVAPVVNAVAPIPVDFNTKANPAALIESKSITDDYDPNKGTPKLVSKPLETDSIELGPSTRTWSRGCSVGVSRPASQDESKSSMPADRSSAPEPSKESPEHKEVVEPVNLTVPPVPVDSNTKAILKDLDDDDKELMASIAIFIIDDYLHSNDFKVAIHRILRSSFLNHYISVFVSASVSYVLDRSSKARLGLGHLLRVMLSRGKLNQNQLFQGLESIFENVTDLEIDIPKLWLYLAEIFLPLMQAGFLTLDELGKGVTICTQQKCGGKMFSNLLHVMRQQLGCNKVKELWKNSELEWSDILCPGEDPTEFVSANKLEFTAANAQTTPENEISIEQLERCLDTLFEKSFSNEIIIDWIEAKLSKDRLSDPTFIRSLISSITKEFLVGGRPEKFNIQKLEYRTEVLKKYIAGNVDLELQTIHAFQALDQKLQHSKGLLIRIFQVLHDENVIIR